MKISTFAFVGATALVLSITAPGFAAEPIVGKWKTESGELAKIASCGSAYCIRITTGQFAGKQVGKLTGSGSQYKGSITDPADDKTYSGSAKVNGASMSLRGCALKIFCKTQKWKKQ